MPFKHCYCEGFHQNDHDLVPQWHDPWSVSLVYSKQTATASSGIVYKRLVLQDMSFSF